MKFARILLVLAAALFAAPVLGSVPAQEALKSVIPQGGVTAETVNGGIGS
jgi:hypothetical protein